MAGTFALSLVKNLGTLIPTFALGVSTIALSFQVWSVTRTLANVEIQEEERQRKDLPKSTKKSILEVQKRLLQPDTSNRDENLQGHLGFSNLLRKIFEAAKIELSDGENWRRNVLGQKVGSIDYYGNDYDQLGPYVTVSGTDRGNANDEPEDFVQTFDSTLSVHLYVNLGWATKKQGKLQLVYEEPIPKAGNSYRMIRMEFQFFHPNLLTRFWDDLVNADFTKDGALETFASQLERIGVIAFPLRWCSYHPAPGKKDFLLQYTLREGIPEEAFKWAYSINHMVWGDTFELSLADKHDMGPSLAPDDIAVKKNAKQQSHKEAIEIGRKLLELLERKP